MTMTLGHRGQVTRRDTRTDTLGFHVGRVGLGSIGVLTLLVSAWGGIIPYLGPSFGYDAQGVGAWSWSAEHSVLALAPGALGVLLGLAMLGETAEVASGRGRVSLATTGLFALICGAWFVIGPFAWPVISGSGPVFVSASSLRELEDLVGYSLGPGAILAACGAFAVGWASRHQEIVASSVEATAAAMTVSGQPNRPAGARPPWDPAAF